MADGIEDKKREPLRREYDEDFKAKVVARIAKGETGKAVALDLGISPTLATRWRRLSLGLTAEAVRKKVDPKKEIKKVASPLETEMARLKLQVKNVEALPNGRRLHEEAFKKQAAAMVVKRGMTMSDVAKQLGVHYTQITEWVREARGLPKYRRGARPGPQLERMKPKSGYVRVADRPGYQERQYEKSGIKGRGIIGVVDGGGVSSSIPACISMLKGVKARVNLDDPVHLTAMLVLQTLQGKL